MKKFNIKKNKEALSEQEIQQHMNFDKFISGYTPPAKGWFSGKVALKNVIASASVVVITVAGYFIYQSVVSDEKTAIAPFVCPPIPAMDIPKDAFVINTNADSTFVYTTGTLITVPSGAFVDTEGKTVSGEVQLHYREFHDPIDILLSGIPMNYDSAGTEYQFESAGMFEITASKDGKPVSLKPGKIVQVNMISHTNNPVDYNFYKLDTVQRKWEYTGENTVANKTCNPVFERNNVTDKSDKAGRTKDDEFIAAAKPILPQKVKNGTANFSIDFNKDEFPELAPFNGLKFEPVKGEKQYNAALAKKTWEEVLIERDSDNEHYNVTFSKGKESHRFKVIPVVEESEYAAVMKTFEQKQKQYEGMLAARKRAESERTDSLYQLNSLYKGMAMRSNLNERFKNFVDGSYEKTSKDLLAYRTFAISRLGTWNCDCPIPYFSTYIRSGVGTHIAHFSMQDSKPVVLEKVFLIRRSVNSIYVVNAGNFKHFPFSPESSDVMIGITTENELVYLKDEELKNVTASGKNVYFKMKATGSDISTAAQLKNLLKI
ncbi:MAG TPA: hypothetical protein VGC65_02505 [Bacteroidia bacterium]|jgi:hypothetical protein